MSTVCNLSFSTNRSAPRERERGADAQDWALWVAFARWVRWGRQARWRWSGAVAQARGDKGAHVPLPLTPDHELVNGSGECDDGDLSFFSFPSTPPSSS